MGQSERQIDDKWIERAAKEHTETIFAKMCHIYPGLNFSECFRILASALADAMREQAERDAVLVEQEPEFPGGMPKYVREALEMLSLEEQQRAACRSTKKAIIQAIRRAAGREDTR